VFDLANIILNNPLPIEDKVALMRENAKFDVADGEEFTEDELIELEGIKAKAPPPKVPKVFLSNDCIFNCSYCCCRASLCNKRRYANEPRILAEDSVKQALSIPTRGVFITSAIYKNADYTEELIIETLKYMRFDLKYKGYIHAKIMPGTDPQLIEEAGWLADRLSINIELPKSEGYDIIAKQKNKQNILKPMGDISKQVANHKFEKNSKGRLFAKSGQTTQMIVGAMKENDRIILNLAAALYKKYNLKRVYYSGFGLPSQQFDFFPENPTPHWRTRRLYQADRLLQLYGFKSDEIVPEESPDMQFDIDPKAAWALRNLNFFPVEVNTADYEALIRVPGIGITYAKKILFARNNHTLTHDLLLQIGVSLKRARYFITCNGKYDGDNLLGNPLLRNAISDKSSQIPIIGELI
jgi:putative DNA modification/repair radical SAM protein